MKKRFQVTFFDRETKSTWIWDGDTADHYEFKNEKGSKTLEITMWEATACQASYCNDVESECGRKIE